MGEWDFRHLSQQLGSRQEEEASIFPRFLLLMPVSNQPCQGQPQGTPLFFPMLGFKSPKESAKAGNYPERKMEGRGGPWSQGGEWCGCPNSKGPPPGVPHSPQPTPPLF